MPQAKSDIHVTPDIVFELIEKYWGLVKDNLFDPCPINPRYDGLKIPWRKYNFVNPPYSNLNEWVAKAIWEANLNRETIMLLPSKTEQLFFHQLLSRDYEIKWIRKRLRFKNNKQWATQPHFLVMIK